MAKTTEKKLKDFTQREVLQAVIDGRLEAAAPSGQTVMQKLVEMVEKIDKRNAANKEKEKKQAKKVDNTVEKKIILDFLLTQDEGLTSKDIATAVNLTIAKTNAVLRQMTATDETVDRLDLGSGKSLNYRAKR